MAVFDSLYADSYDQLYSAKDYIAECDMIEAAISRHAGSRVRSVLDVGCGTGNHSLELARRGYEATGVDLSQPMLVKAAAKAGQLPAERRPTWICGDVRAFDTGRKHDAAIMMFAVIGYLTTNEDVLQGLRNVRRHLVPGAPFVCDFWYGPAVLSQRPGDRVRVLDQGSRRVLRAASTRLDTLTHTADVTFRLWSMEGNQVVAETTEVHRTRYFFPQEFALFVSQSGFALQSLSAFPSLDAKLGEDTWNAIAVARAV